MNKSFLPSLSEMSVTTICDPVSSIYMLVSIKLFQQINGKDLVLIKFGYHDHLSESTNLNTFLIDIVITIVQTLHCMHENGWKS